MANIISYADPKDAAHLRAICKAGKLRVDQTMNQFYFNSPRQIISAIAYYSTQWSKEFIEFFRTSPQYKALCDKAMTQPKTMTHDEIVAYALTVKHSIAHIDPQALTEAAYVLGPILGEKLANNVKTMALAIQYTTIKLPLIKKLKGSETVARFTWDEMADLIVALAGPYGSEKKKGLEKETINAYESAFKELNDNRHYINLAGTVLPRHFENVCLAYANLNSTFFDEQFIISNVNFEHATFKNAKFANGTITQSNLKKRRF